MNITINIEKVIFMAPTKQPSTDDLIIALTNQVTAMQAALLQALAGIELTATDLTPVLTAIANGDSTIEQGIAAINALIVPTPATPAVTAVSPATGAVAGGTVLTVTGTGLTGASAVNFSPVGGGTPIAGVIGSGGTDTSLPVTSPALAAGQYDVTVVTPNGTSAVVTADQFTAA